MWTKVIFNPNLASMTNKAESQVPKPGFLQKGKFKTKNQIEEISQYPLLEDEIDEQKFKKSHTAPQQSAWVDQGNKIIHCLRVCTDITTSN